MVIDEWVAVDEELKNPEYIVSLLKSIKPINEKEEKERFFENNCKIEPNFTYNSKLYDFNLEKERLKKINIPKGDFECLFEKKRQEKLLLNDLKSFRGTDKFLELSLKIYGAPLNSTIKNSEILIKNHINTESESKNISSKQLVEIINGELENYKINNWAVLESDRKMFTVSPEKFEIYVPKRSYGNQETKKLLLHEIGGHVLRANNGATQPLSDIFSIGLPGYLETEEGLSFYLQELNELMSQESLMKMSVNVLTVNNVVNGEKFSSTYGMLKDLGFEDSFSWTRTLRAYRGGGLTKDHLYSSGIDKVRKHHKSGNSLKDLYVGKVSISDLDWINPLIEKGILKKPKYLPNCKVDI